MRVWNLESRKQVSTVRLLFWSYLWGFETVSSTILGLGKSLVLELPMRVWNATSYICHVFRTMFWSYLWGFETHSQQWQFFRNGEVLELPMRVWNSAGTQKEEESSGVLELPMRVWNSSVPNSVPNSPSFWSYLWGFETPSLPRVSAKVKGFGVTYEGLKPRFWRRLWRRHWWFWSYLWGFETQKCPRECHRAGPVLELPMRVWNSWSPPM